MHTQIDFKVWSIIGSDNTAFQLNFRLLVRQRIYDNNVKLLQILIVIFQIKVIITMSPESPSLILTLALKFSSP